MKAFQDLLYICFQPLCLPCSCRQSHPLGLLKKSNFALFQLEICALKSNNYWIRSRKFGLEMKIKSLQNCSKSSLMYGSRSWILSNFAKTLFSFPNRIFLIVSNSCLILKHIFPAWNKAKLDFLSSPRGWLCLHEHGRQRGWKQI